MSKKNINLDDLLERAYESDDPQEVRELLERVLEVLPDDPEALLLLADLTEEDEERVEILTRAMESARGYLDEEGVGDGELQENELGLVYLALMQRMAFTLFALEEDERAFEIANKLICYDLDDHGSGKSLYYRILLERRDWPRILRETMQDSERKLGWAYARLAAAFMSAKSGGKEVGEGALTKKLWEAVRLAPNAPFYMLGYFPEPELPSDSPEEMEWEEEVFHFSILYEEVWSLSHDLLNWFSKNVILFGLLSGRFGEESADMEEILDSLGGAPEYREMAERLKGASDDAVILKALASRTERG